MMNFLMLHELFWSLYSFMIHLFILTSIAFYINSLYIYFDTNKLTTQIYLELWSFNLPNQTPDVDYVTMYSIKHSATPGSSQIWKSMSKNIDYQLFQHQPSPIFLRSCQKTSLIKKVPSIKQNFTTWLQELV